MVVHGTLTEFCGIAMAYLHDHENLSVQNYIRASRLDTLMATPRQSSTFKLANQNLTDGENLGKKNGIPVIGKAGS